MNYASNVFVSYRLFILKIRVTSMPLNLTFEFLSLFCDVAINVNGNLLFSNFIQSLTSCLLKLKGQESVS